MALHWRPVGPLPAATYWRRRAVVGVLALVALWLVLRLLSGLGGDGDDTLEPAASPTPSTSAAPSPEPTPTPTESATPQPCGDDVLEVQATAEQADVAPGARTPLTLSVRNTGSVPCLRAVGQGAVELVVTSGADRIWSSDDCNPGGEAGERLLQPGEVYSARATFPGTRSAPGCPPDQPAAQPGTYRVTARVGELRSEGMVFRVVEG